MRSSNFGEKECNAMIEIGPQFLFDGFFVRHDCIELKHHTDTFVKSEKYKEIMDFKVNNLIHAS